MGEVLLEGLRKAKDDTKILNDTSFDKNFGMCLYNRFYEHFPMFFTRFGSEIDLVGQYHGASIFLICNGPSLASGKYDLTLLKRPGIVTYGMNNGARTIRPNFWTCVDSPERFLKSIWLDPVITKIVPLTFAEKPIFDNEQWQTAKIRVQDCPNIVYFRRNEKFVADRYLKELTTNWGNHKDFGGGRSVMLAILRVMFLLGFRNVFLMGADFKMSESYTYHFDEQRAKGAVNGNNDTYHKLMTQYFPALRPQFEAEGFNVYNCNPDSELKVFDYVPYEDAIQFAMAPLGDVDNERTWGMYSKPEERQQWVNEPPDAQKPHLSNIVRQSTPVYIDNRQEDPVEQPMQQELQEPEIRRPVVQRPNVQKPIVTQPNIQRPNVQKPVRYAQPNVQRPITQAPTNSPRPMVPRPPIPNRPVNAEENQPRRIVRNVPCGGGSSFGSSGSGQQGITITDK